MIGKRMPPAPPTVDPGSGLPPRRRGIAIASVLATLVLVVLDAAIANVALPTIARSLRVTPAQSVWVVTAYQIALVMALLPCGALGESLGHRKVFTAGVAIFTAASALCAFAVAVVAGRGAVRAGAGRGGGDVAGPRPDPLRGAA
jgi:DHA2 family multidrug resistance protein-like MFS transporter